ncbi:sialidase family protein [Brachyspira pilosicoli]|uniref:sialidase family protein n=1 Tax=Brachyspira pilosicoli TaxID=52584 RepID=UPI00242C3F28|nr:sialidase family protein [Brachyspira pilosicoli]
MFKKYLIFSFIILLISCGTDYYYSSFVIRKDLQWPIPPSEQANLSTHMSIASSFTFNTYTSPSVIATPANYILTIYEVRDNPSFNQVLGVDGSSVVNVKLNISLDAQSFKERGFTVGKSAAISEDSKGSPIAFLNKKGEVIVLAIGGTGLSDGPSDKSESKIFKSKSTNNGYQWSDWEKLETNVFDPLLKDQYNRYYTNPGNGITLRNGTLACMIDFKKRGNGNTNPEGAAILYSTDGGETWKIGGKMMYNGNYRSARIIAERTDGKLLIAAVSYSTTVDYKYKGPLKWGIADTINSEIKDFSVTGLPNANSSGTVSGGRINFSYNNISTSGILLLHSGPDRQYTGPNGLTYTVVNSSSISVSQDEGKTWNTITNIVGTQYKDRASFRQSLSVLKDGTLALALEEGNSYDISSTSGQHFVLVLRRISLEALSEGTYKYEGL